jgi:hypothetical protein
MILNKILHWFGFNHLAARRSEIDQAGDETTERNVIEHTRAVERMRATTRQTILTSEKLRGSILRMKAYADLEYSLQHNAKKERPAP